MNLLNYPLVIFDWDGTLMNSVGQIVNALQQSCVDINLPMPSYEGAAYAIGLSIQEVLRQVAPTATPDQLEQLLNRYRYHYLKSENEIFLYPKALELMQSLQQHNIKMAVATGKNRVGLNRVLKTSPLQSFFATTRCADESEPKPSAAMVNEILEELGVHSSQAIVIGDTTHDVWMAKNAKVNVVALTQGAHSRDELEKSEPTLILDHIAQLYEHINRATR